jgi:hypothetical protein
MPGDLKDLVAGGASALGVKSFDALKALLQKVSPADLAKLAKSAEEEGEEVEVSTGTEVGSKAEEGDEQAELD